MKKVKIKLYHNKRGNTYGVRTLRECMDIVLNKMGIDLMDFSYSNLAKIDYIEKCVEQAYDINQREIIVTLEKNKY